MDFPEHFGFGIQVHLSLLGFLLINGYEPLCILTQTVSFYSLNCDFFFPFWGMLGARGWGLGWQGRHGGVRNPWFPCLKRSYWLPFEVTIILVLCLR